MTIATFNTILLKNRLFKGLDILYNVKIYRYPAGWQVRTYSTIVGYHEKPDHLYHYTGDILPYPCWDGELEEYVYERIPDKKDTWWNPFTMREEAAPVEYDEDEILRKKKRSLASSMNRTVNAVYKIARSNIWEWFVTLTFNPEKVDSLDYSDTVKKLSKWLNNSKTLCPDMGYVIIPELHESGRYHFHGLFRGCNDLGFVDSGHFDKKGNKVYNIGKYKLGWVTATKVQDQTRVTKYIAKYINKDLCSVAFNKRRYWCSRNLADADVQEVVLDKDKMALLVSRLESSATFVKRIKNSEVVTTYYELPKEVTLDDEI